jgi:60 kDa SS-A/Ro ribonucleoprotein
VRLLLSFENTVPNFRVPFFTIKKEGVMARLNVAQKLPPVRTHEGAPACRVSATEELRRSVMACLLFEKSFYEDGVDIATRIAGLVPKVKQADLEKIVVEARERQNLRHAPLFICALMARHKMLRPEILTRVCQRADEPGEFLALYAEVNGWKPNDIKGPCRPVMKGLAGALKKYNAYGFAKYDRDAAIKLRDVFRLVHPKPDNKEQADLWKKVVDRSLPPPETWETILSGAKNAGLSKKDAWEKVIDIWIDDASA